MTARNTPTNISASRVSMNHRHRLDGSEPSGKMSRMTSSRPSAGAVGAVKIDERSTRYLPEDWCALLSSEPQRPPRRLAPIATPDPRLTHPSGLLGRRIAINAPMTGTDTSGKTQNPVKPFPLARNDGGVTGE